MIINDVFDSVWIGDAIDGDLNFRLTSAGDTDPADSHHALKEALANLDVANILVKHVVGVFGQNAFAQGCLVIRYGQSRSERLKVPVGQHD